MTAVPTPSALDFASSYSPPSFSTPGFATVTKRDGRVDGYDRSRISLAIEMAFRAEARAPYPDALEYSMHEEIERVTVAVEHALSEQFSADAPLVIERIQDEVERQLMAAGHFAVARRFILYRDARAQRRKGGRIRIRVRRADGRDTLLEGSVLHARIREAAADLGAFVDVEAVYAETLSTLYDGIAPAEVSKAAVMAARAH